MVSGPKGDPGPAGPQGAQGPVGADGHSVYTSTDSYAADVGGHGAIWQDSTDAKGVGDVVITTNGKVGTIVGEAMIEGRKTWYILNTADIRGPQGIDKPYELIEEITLTENVDSIARTTDTQGNAYNFKAILIYAKFSANTDNSSIRVYVNGFSDMVCNAQNIIGTSSKFAKIDISCNREVISANVIHSSSPAGTAYVVSEPYFFVGHSAITGVELVATKGIPSGSNIKIYGARA